MLLGEVESWSELDWTGFKTVLDKLPPVREKVRDMSHCLSDCWTQLDNTQRLLSTLTEVNTHTGMGWECGSAGVTGVRLSPCRRLSGVTWCHLHRPPRPHLLSALSPPSLRHVSRTLALWLWIWAVGLYWTSGLRLWSAIRKLWLSLRAESCRRRRVPLRSPELSARPAWGSPRARSSRTGVQERGVCSPGVRWHLSSGRRTARR